MKKTVSKQTGALKNKIESVSQKSKETIKALVETNAKQFDSALEASSNAYNTINETLYQQDMDASMISTFKSTFGKSLKLSEEAIDAVINSHTNRMELSIDFTTQIMNALKSDDIATTEGMERLIAIVKENFTKSTELSMHNMEKMVTEYNNHLNLSMNFNKKFIDNVNSQLAAVAKLQKKNSDGLFTADMLN